MKQIMILWVLLVTAPSLWCEESAADLVAKYTDMVATLQSQVDTLELGAPEGPVGDQGPQGETGDQGAAGTVTVTQTDYDALVDTIQNATYASFAAGVNPERFERGTQVFMDEFEHSIRKLNETLLDMTVDAALIEE